MYGGLRRARALQGYGQHTTYQGMNIISKINMKMKMTIILIKNDNNLWVFVFYDLQVYVLSIQVFTLIVL